MKKGLMVQFPYGRGRKFVCKNIGDYIQYAASKQFCEEFDEYIDQEEAYQYYPEDKQKIKLIMNGWFQWRAENWPPSDFIYPLLVSMHISPLKADQLLTEEGVAFLRKYGPVGCRDMETKRLLDEKGVPAYFSACLTLTFQEKYYVHEREREGYYFVDPYFEIPDIITSKDGRKKIELRYFISTLCFFLRNIFAICKLGKDSFFKDYSPTGFLDRNSKWYRPYYKATLFYRDYSKKFTKKFLLKAQYITHWVDVDIEHDTNDKLINIAEQLVKKYASAKMVITSRIHAGLPALGLDTPVIFISNEKILSDEWKFNTPGRLDGIIDFFRVLVLHDGSFSTFDEELEKLGKIDIGAKFINKSTWRPYAEKLKTMCKDFMMKAEE